ncbi:WXG100 family type VII secretion target [Mycobacterium sp. 050134]|uniref:WXG100 family type VII secretion target n=1 Tax=Mycobacterium sp. 050134 TaxID=3096111 RepID=UPI002EDA3BD8
MGIERPTGPYAGQMLDPDAWPEVDEDTFYDRAQQYTQVLHELTTVLEACQHQSNQVFNGGIWSGGAANAARGEIETIVGELDNLQSDLATVITWHRQTAQAVAHAKSIVGDNVEAAQKQIIDLENDSELDASERAAAIKSTVTVTYAANVRVVADAARQIDESRSWRAPRNALQELLDQKTPPSNPSPEAPPASPTRPETDERPDTDSPAQTISPTAPVRPSQPTPGGSQSNGVVPPTQGPAGGQVRPGPSPNGPGLGMPAATGGAPAAPLSPAASAKPITTAGTSKGMTPASLSVASRTDESASPANPSPALGVPASAMAPDGLSSGRAAAGAVAPASRKPSSAPSASPNVRPTAGGNKKQAGSGASAHGHGDTSNVVVVPPVIPVSASRVRRDLVAEAATAEAARRAGPDPVRVARRIAAALNAPGSPGARDLGFFWVTAVTTSGAIVLANSYGLAYIPEGVQLPEGVELATADDAIAISERARWATYPVMAVQGWAAHRNVELRAVIGTEEQLANSDSGAVKILLEPEDIPDSGAIVGRSRLEIVDPEAAIRLVATADSELNGLLPPPPARAGIKSDALASERAADATEKGRGGRDAEPSDDRRPLLWFDVMKPLSSRASGRRVAHLRAFHRYAVDAQEVSLSQAHSAIEPTAQRAAIADWLYWTKLGELHGAALQEQRPKLSRITRDFS